MATKVLNVEKNSLITSECFTFYKFAIMQTMPNFDLWLASHMHIFVDHEIDANFGIHGLLYPLSYYMDMLEFTDAGILSVSEKDIVQFLIDHIDQDEYVIVDLNFEKLYDINSNSTYIHETMIYGYDTERKEVMTFLLENGTFHERRIKFENLLAAYKDAYDLNWENEKSIFDKRRFFYGLTIVKPRDTYKNTNVYYEFIIKLRDEIEGKIFCRQICAGSLEKLEKTYTYYTGLSGMLYLAKWLQEKKESIYHPKRACLGLYENQRIILRSMRWIINEIDAGNELLIQSVSDYEECCDRMYMNVLALYKFDYVEDDKILLRVAESLKQLYEQEKGILSKFSEEILESYVRLLLSDAMPQKSDQ